MQLTLLCRYQSNWLEELFPVTTEPLSFTSTGEEMADQDQSTP